jgi:hypothetical protein
MGTKPGVSIRGKIVVVFENRVLKRISRYRKKKVIEKLHNEMSHNLFFSNNIYYKSRNFIWVHSTVEKSEMYIKFYL